MTIRKALKLASIGFLSIELFSNEKANQLTARKSLKYVAVGLLALDVLSPAPNGMNAPTCTNRTKCSGLKKNGQLRKGYKFVPGGGIKKV